MAWLLRDGDVLASLEIAADRSERRVGLLGRAGIEGALWLEPARMIHTLGMRFPIDVGYLRPDPVDDGCWHLLAASTVEPGRLGAPRLKARAVLEAEAGAFARWGLAVGDVVEVRR